MLKIIKDAFKLTNKNLMLVCSLYLFSIVSTVYFAFSQVAANASGQMVILYCLTMVAFFAGFFNQIKSAVKNEEGKFKFLEGIGDYYLPMLGIGLLSLVIYVIFAEVATLLSAKLVGGSSVLVAAMNKTVEVMQANNFDVSALDMQALQVVSIFMLVLWGVWCVVSFVILYWVPVLFFDNEHNIFKSLGRSVVYLFRNFGKSFLVFLLLLIPVVLLSVLSVAFSSFKIVAVLSNVLVYYVSVAFLFAIFLLYADRTVEKIEEVEDK